MSQNHPDGTGMLVQSCPPISEMVTYKLHRKWNLKRVPIQEMQLPSEASGQPQEVTTGISDLQGWCCEGDDISRVVRPSLENASAPVVRYTNEEYSQLPQSNWTRKEDDHLLDLVTRFHERWVIIHDRFKYKRTLLELKARYFSVLEFIQQLRGVKVTDHYNPQDDIDRRQKIQQFEQDELLIKELTNLQLNLKGMENQRNNVKRDHVSDGLAKITLTQICGEPRKKKKRAKDVPDSKRRKSLAPIGEDSDADMVSYAGRPASHQAVKKEKKVTGGITLRSQILPPFKSIVTQQKIDGIMQELGIMNIPIMPTVNICKAYDELHKAILQLIDVRKNLDKLDGPSRERSMSINQDDGAEWGQLKRQSSASLNKETKRRKV